MLEIRYGTPAANPQAPSAADTPAAPPPARRRWRSQPEPGAAISRRMDRELPLPSEYPAPSRRPDKLRRVHRRCRPTTSPSRNRGACGLWLFRPDPRWYGIRCGQTVTERQLVMPAQQMDHWCVAPKNCERVWTKLRAMGTVGLVTGSMAADLSLLYLR